MAKANATRRSQRQGQVVDVDEVEKTDTVSSSEHMVGTEKGAPKGAQDEQDHQMDTAIEVKGSASTVTISWDKKNEEGGVASDPMMDSEGAPIESAEMAVTESDGVQKETNGGEQMKKTPAKGKRKAGSAVEATPPKKTKLLNDGYCLYVGNLNHSKTFDEIKTSLSNYFMTQHVKVEEIRMDRSKKYAFVDLASEMDLTKGLTLNGQLMHDKQMKIAKAKVRSEDQVKTPAKTKMAKDDKCLFLKNVPYNATTKDILKIFCQAVDVRYPDGTEGPTKGIAFVEFKNKNIAQKVWQQNQGVEIQGRVLIVDCAGQTNAKAIKANAANAGPNTTLFVSNLPFNVTDKILKKTFQTAVSISVPKSDGKPRGFAFVEFAAVADAEKALESSQKMKMYKRTLRVQFCQVRSKSVREQVQSKTLIVMGLAEKTTEATLLSAFEGALRARLPADKDTGVPKGFGFVDFESEDNCTAVKEAMQDCEIEGRKVTVAYAKSPLVEAPATPGKQPAAPAAGGDGRKRKRPRGKKGKKPGAGDPQDAVKEGEIKV